jgi:hypothetical protein
MANTETKKATVGAKSTAKKDVEWGNLCDRLMSLGEMLAPVLIQQNQELHSLNVRKLELEIKTEELELKKAELELKVAEKKAGV